MSVGQRIKEARIDAGLKPKELAKAAKMAPTTLYDLESDRKKSTTKIAQIAAATGWSPLYLETGKLPKKPERKFQTIDKKRIMELFGTTEDDGFAEEFQEEFAKLSARDTSLLRVPIVGHTQGGPDVEWVELGYPSGWGDEFFELLCPDPNAYGLIIRGDSMHPKFSEGEAVCVAPNMDSAPGDFVILKKVDGSVMLKRFASQSGTRYVFDSINNGHGRIVLDQEEIEFLHYVYAGLPMSAIRHV